MIRQHGDTGGRRWGNECCCVSCTRHWLLILGGYVSVQGMAKRGGVDQRLRALRYINRGGRRIRGDRRKEVLGQTEYTPTRTHTHNEATIHLAHTLRTTGYCQCSPPDVCCRCRRRLLELEGVPEHRRPHVPHQAGRPATSSGVSGHWGHP